MEEQGEHMNRAILALAILSGSSVGVCDIVAPAGRVTASCDVEDRYYPDRRVNARESLLRINVDGREVRSKFQGTVSCSAVLASFEKIKSEAVLTGKNLSVPSDIQGSRSEYFLTDSKPNVFDLAGDFHCDFKDSTNNFTITAGCTKPVKISVISCMDNGLMTNQMASCSEGQSATDCVNSFKSNSGEIKTSKASSGSR
jgi:hypothetical protein